MSKITRRRLLAGVSASALLHKSAQAGFAGGGIHIGAGTGGGASSLPTTMTLANNTGSTVPDGTFVMFGHPFKKGDIPNAWSPSNTGGAAPTFKIGATAQAFSWGCQTYWSDGSLKFAAFLMRTATAGAAGITTSGATVTIDGGGTAPSGSRAATDVYAQNLVVSATAAPISAGTGTGQNANLSGTWTADLQNNAFNYNASSPLVYLTGDAGTMWKFSVDMQQSGAAHGQLVVDHYIAALTASGGGLAGFLYLPMITQPFWNAYPSHTSVTPNWRAFSTSPLPSWSVNGGAANSLAWPTGPSGGWAAQTCSFNGAGLGTLTGTNANDYFRGGDTGGAGPCRTTLAVYFSGLSDTSVLDPNRIYTCTTNAGGTNLFWISNWTSTRVGADVIPVNGTTGTIHPVPLVTHFGRLPFATEGAGSPTYTGCRYNYFKGSGGGASTNPILNCQFNQAYWRTTQHVPPYNTAAGAMTAPQDVDWLNAPEYLWAPGLVGNTGSSGTAGERPGIAPINTDHVRHFFLQSAKSEFMARMDGLGGAGAGYNCRDWNNKSYNFGNLCNRNGPSKSYTGLPSYTDSGAIKFYSANGPAGVDGLPIWNQQFGAGWETCITEHLPEYSYYPYLITGEPHLLDILMETGLQGNIQDAVIRYNTTNNIPISGGAYGVVTGFSDEIRTMAWAFRNMATAAGMCPKFPPDGSGIWQMYDDQATLNARYPVALMDPANAAYQADGATAKAQAYLTQVAYYWTPLDPNGQFGVIAAISPWQQAYFDGAHCFNLALREDTYSSQWLTIRKNCLNYFYNQFGGGQGVYCYYDIITTIAAGTVPTSNLIEDDSHWGTSNDTSRWFAPDNPPVPQINYISTSGGPGAGAFTYNPVHSGYVPTNGDGIIIASNGSPTGLPASMSFWQPYILSNVSGPVAGAYRFDLAPSGVAGGTYSPVIATGSIITPGSNGTIQGPGGSFLVRPSGPNATGIPGNQGGGGAQGYCPNIRGIAAWATYLGVSGYSTILSDALTRMNAEANTDSPGTTYATNTSIGWPSIPKYAIVET